VNAECDERGAERDDPTAHREQPKHGRGELWLVRQDSGERARHAVSPRDERVRHENDQEQRERRVLARDDARSRRSPRHGAEVRPSSRQAVDVRCDARRDQQRRQHQRQVQQRGDGVRQRRERCIDERHRRWVHERRDRKPARLLEPHDRLHVEHRGRPRHSTRRVEGREVEESAQRHPERW
jgi:hypothetical protein